MASSSYSQLYFALLHSYFHCSPFILLLLNYSSYSSPVSSNDFLLTGTGHPLPEINTNPPLKRWNIEAVTFALADNSLRLAQAYFFHRHPTAATTHVLHLRKYIFADMPGVYLGAPQKLHSDLSSPGLHRCPGASDIAQQVLHV